MSIPRRLSVSERQQVIRALELLAEAHPDKKEVAFGVDRFYTYRQLVDKLKGGGPDAEKIWHVFASGVERIGLDATLRSIQSSAQAARNPSGMNRVPQDLS